MLGTEIFDLITPFNIKVDAGMRVLIITMLIIAYVMPAFSSSRAWADWGFPWDAECVGKSNT